MFKLEERFTRGHDDRDPTPLADDRDSSGILITDSNISSAYDMSLADISLADDNIALADISR